MKEQMPMQNVENKEGALERSLKVMDQMFINLTPESLQERLAQNDQEEVEA